MTQQIEQFLLTNISMAIFFASLLLLRKVFGKRLSPRLRGAFWYLPFLSLLFLIPNQPFRQLSEYLRYNYGTKIYFPDQLGSSNSGEAGGEALSLAKGWMNDYSLAANQPNFVFFLQIFAVVWLIGMVIRAGMILFSYYSLHRLIVSGQVLDSDRINRALSRAQRTLHYQSPVQVIASTEIQTPATSGMFRPVILLPEAFSEEASEEQLYLIFMHELGHHKNKDFYQQTLFLLFTIIFWYNPLIHWMNQAAAKDREVACDHLVMAHLAKKEITAYGHALLNSVVQKPTHQLVAFSDNHKGLTERIQFIAAYQKEKKFPLLQGLSILLLIISVFVAVPQSEGTQKASLLKDAGVIKIFADRAFADDSLNSLVLYDEEARQYSIYNEAAAYQRFSPDSTYKLWSGLFGLKHELIQPEQNQLAWDGTEYPFAAWNQDQGLSEAFTNSTNWYFQQLDQKLGKATLTEEFKAVNYGNASLLGSVDDYWLESSLKIAPIEQVQLLKQLINHELAFSDQDVQTIKEAMKLESGEGYTLYGKTGTGQRQGQDNRGWFVGFIEAKGQTHYFACHLQQEGTSGQSAAAETLRILRENAIY
ncbi:BlaR1 family beta-lactam sensor/signal transducer [Enterococcus sp. 669A]|uniref:BlaR1 family beta-lactam sensor/signal transducer n=1 Tax=Candidatus Enterococcus moelleringii TaxID=2815325 RepID=A0ABS3LBQ7_9ENTE|nr:BlaR1 family beta-lactam sensor/signal transducer [Enterococcus sp. 669A]MBO1307062.1 BlaR1 family beta-lactam sensor/signal transducer [Enterococcus sp. 669A]